MKLFPLEENRIIGRNDLSSGNLKDLSEKNADDVFVQFTKHIAMV